MTNFTEPFTKCRDSLPEAVRFSRYTQAFHRKFIEEVEPSEEPILGTGDIQSLADLGNSFEISARCGSFRWNSATSSR